MNAADNSGKTALMMAAENGQAGAVGMCSTCGLHMCAYPKLKLCKVEISVIILVYTCKKDQHCL